MLYSFLVHVVGPFLNLINGRPIVAGKENLPKGNYILVAPHRSWMDPVLLALAIYPKKFAFMAKEEIFKNKFANYFLRKLNAFPVNRVHPGPSAIKTPVQILKQTDLATIIFPSGSRYSSKLKGGALVIAKLAGVPLVPVVYQGPLKFKQLFRRDKRRIAIGKPITIDRKMKLSEETMALISQQMQSAFDNLDHQLDPNYHYQMPEKPADDHF
ncbi:MAG TPA: 1-acyl-sn-glycerol-3-phosphate acyltransferase [Candidatus Limosilactobacillus faecipullorum]|nr:1-acyl-sn-glycerol-3-phosphate acyltransferase [Candidatus Limosilactobacillus faecipullorum]